MRSKSGEEQPGTVSTIWTICYSLVRIRCWIPQAAVFAFLMSDGLGLGIGGNGGDSYWIFGGNWTLNDNGSFVLTAVPESSSLVLTAVPEGGAYTLYTLLACGSCFGAMILNSRDRLAKA